VLGCAWAVWGCVPATRSEPSLEEKCEDLVTFCADMPAARTDLRQCYDVGRRGAREPKHRDQCFFSWDECIDECVYLYQGRASAPDGG
jgi:hypothetical protein